MILVYCRNLIHFGDFKCFTYDSIITGDHEIRLRHQGPNFSWRIDSNAKHAWFIPYTQVNVVGRRDTTRTRSSASSNTLKSRGPCYKWLQGEKCDAKHCKWAHRCNVCKTKDHVMEKCENRNTYMAKIKTFKPTKPKVLWRDGPFGGGTRGAAWWSRHWGSTVEFKCAKFRGQRFQWWFQESFNWWWATAFVWTKIRLLITRISVTYMIM